mmetsp:Transcript_68899/g.186178  ORF Transcript_68899/g.186178 Transcript_68899/m.186178 type:complete len:300 (+) Transcript_68899:41-940(+)
MRAEAPRGSLGAQASARPSWQVVHHDVVLGHLGRCRRASWRRGAFERCSASQRLLHRLGSHVEQLFRDRAQSLPVRLLPRFWPSGHLHEDAVDVLGLRLLERLPVPGAGPALENGRHAGQRLPILRRTLSPSTAISAHLRHKVVNRHGLAGADGVERPASVCWAASCTASETLASQLEDEIVQNRHLDAIVAAVADPARERKEKYVRESTIQPAAARRRLGLLRRLLLLLLLPAGGFVLVLVVLRALVRGLVRLLLLPLGLLLFLRLAVRHGPPGRPAALAGGPCSRASCSRPPRGASP